MAPSEERSFTYVKSISTPPYFPLPRSISNTLSSTVCSRFLTSHSKNSIKERHRERVLRPERGKESAKGSLVTHRQTQKGVAKGGLGPEGDEEDRGDKPITYRLEFPAKAGPMPCPVEGSSGRALTRTAMRVHFWHRHVRNIVVILEEVNLPHTWCPLCDILVLWKALNMTH